MCRRSFFPAALLLLMVAPLIEVPAASAATVTVELVNEDFRPSPARIRPGDSVTWVNQDREVHTVTADTCETEINNCPFDFALDIGQSGSRSFPTAGTISYFCRLHGQPGVGMAGVVEVGDPVTRVSGEDRIGTAIAVSKDGFPTAGTASAVVLSRADQFADALPGTPLAVRKGGPLLLTSSSALDPKVKAEIQRVLPPGRPVYLLGGDVALAPNVADELSGAGYQVVRFAGENRFDTAVRIARDGLDNPTVILEATGHNFPDALAGGRAGAKVNGAVLLTNGSIQAPETAAYLASRTGVTRYALGGPAAAADPTATAIVGEDRHDTAVKVARTFFTTPASAGVASGERFPDALSGGAHRAGQDGPLLLVPADSVTDVVGAYLGANASSVAKGFVYGGSVAVSDRVKSAVQSAITATA